MEQKLNRGIRILLGIMLIIFGLNKFLEFIPHGEMDEEVMNAFMGLMTNKFILPTVGVVEILVGILLVIKKYANLALIAMFPVSYGMVAFHVAVDIEGGMIAAVIAIMNIYLLVQKRKELAILLQV